jgi:predicted component of viral defense system (DUF524 family)
MSKTKTQNTYEEILVEISKKENEYTELDSQLWIEYSRELPTISKKYGISSSVKQSFAHLLRVKPELEEDFRNWNKLQIEVKQLERLRYLLNRRLDDE